MRKIFLLFIITFLFLPIFQCKVSASQKLNQIPILLYHHILSEAENKSYNSCVVTLEDFEAQMKYLYENNFHTVTLDELEAFLYYGIELPEKSIMIQFDDGYYSNIARAYPILKKYNFKAQIFLITTVVHKKQVEFDPSRFTWIAEESLDAVRDVFEFGSHTNDMHRLEYDGHTGLMLFDEDTIKQDLLKSFRITDKRALAYPRGQFKKSNMPILKDLGVKMAFTVKSGYVNKYSNPYELNRNIIYNITDIESFIKIVDGNLTEENENADKIPILLYHHILSDAENKNYKGNPSVTSLENFEKQMQFLYTNGYTAITEKQLYGYLYDGLELPKKSFLLHFDDGYFSSIVNAYPVLKKYNFHATFFIVGKRTEEKQAPFDPNKPVYIARESFADVRDLVTFASHTYDLHEIVTGTNKTPAVYLDKESLLEDINKSTEFTDNKFSLAYPMGVYSPSVIEMLKESSIKLAYTTKKGYVNRNTNPYKLNRITVYGNTSFDDFKNIFK